jgi:hypothetical protein
MRQRRRRKGSGKGENRIGMMYAYEKGWERRGWSRDERGDDVFQSMMECQAEWLEVSEKE